MSYIINNFVSTLKYEILFLVKFMRKRFNLSFFY